MTYEIIRSSRRTICLRWRPDGTLEVRCPQGLSDRRVEAFVDGKRSWIEKHRPTGVVQPLTEEEEKQLRKQAKTVFSQRVAYYAPLIGVSYGQISVRGQKTRWGSCSAKGNLNFNYLLLLTPETVLDYVVIHELCHRKEMNHSQRFWDLVKSLCPDYPIYRKWLKQNGNSLIAKLP